LICQEKYSSLIPQVARETLAKRFGVKKEQFTGIWLAAGSKLTSPRRLGDEAAKPRRLKRTQTHRSKPKQPLMSSFNPAEKNACTEMTDVLEE
jgi:hypothetical protein